MGVEARISRAAGPGRVGLQEEGAPPPRAGSKAETRAFWSGSWTRPRSPQGCPASNPPPSAAQLCRVADVTRARPHPSLREFTSWKTEGGTDTHPPQLPAEGRGWQGKLRGWAVKGNPLHTPLRSALPLGPGLSPAGSSLTHRRQLWFGLPGVGVGAAEDTSWGYQA